jgi:hypothetical protein
LNCPEKAKTKMLPNRQLLDAEKQFLELVNGNAHFDGMLLSDWLALPERSMDDAPLCVLPLKSRAALAKLWRAYHGAGPAQPIVLFFCFAHK